MRKLLTARRAPGTISTWIRWICTIGVIICIAAFIASSRARYVWDLTDRHVLQLNSGQVQIEKPRRLPGRFRSGFRSHHGASESAIDLESFMFDWHFYPDSWFIRLPLWLPLVLCAAPAGFLWYRRLTWRTRGCCQKCGYELSGLAGRPGQAVTCPECGSRQHRV